MLMPERVKFRKQHRGRMSGYAKRGSTLAFGEFGLKELEPSWITAQQIEAVRITLVRYLKKGGKMWIRIFPDKPVTKKPLEVRMGGGKAEPSFWVAVVKTGRIMFELSGIPELEARDAFRIATQKLPISTQVVVKETNTSEVNNETART